MSVDDEVEIIVLDVKTVARGMRISLLLDSSVVNDTNDVIGTIDDLVVERGQPDHIAYAVLQVGGFLGVGGRLIAVEYGALRISEENDELKIVLPGASREALERFPALVFGA
jgi:hypothetical protein